MIETCPDNTLLSSDTEATLLLCGRFGSEPGEQYAPLTQKEYESLARWLLERKIRPADMLSADAGMLAELVHAKLDHARVGALLRRGTVMALALEKWRRSGLWVLSRSDASYPKRLKKKLGQSAPPLLYGAGTPALLDNGGVAIVGSRDVSEAGLNFTHALARACVRDGMGVISGGAKGVDLAAMQAGGESGGIVVGVLASDLLRASVNRQNRQGIQSGQLVLVSPFNPEAGFNAGNAMARNRYIYTLADYAVVVDSAEGEGGTWAGATEDLRHGWVPLYVRDPGEKPGNRALIAKGGRHFNYPFEEQHSLKNYMQENQLADDLSRPAPGAKVIVQSEIIERAPVKPSMCTQTPEEKKDGVDDISSVDSVQAATSNLDMYEIFMEKIRVFLTGNARTDEEIRIALGLEKAQVKAWLTAAVSQGYLEMQKKPVAYLLPKQKILC